MSRPKPTIILEKVEKETYKAEQVLASTRYLGSIL